MRLHSAFRHAALAAAACLATAAPAAAQEPLDQPQPAQAELQDPTVETDAIRSQMEAIRGVEQLEAIQRQLAQLADQNAQLLRRVEDLTAQNTQLQAEVASLRAQEQLNESRRRAIPEMRLVAQLRTADSSIADIDAGGRLYRVTDAAPFRLVLSDGQVVEAEADFLDSGAVEILIPDLDLRFLLTYRPAAISV